MIKKNHQGASETNDFPSGEENELKLCVFQFQTSVKFKKMFVMFHCQHKFQF